MLKILLLITFCFSQVFAKDTSPLPDGEITTLQGTSAKLISPTTRYAHGVLGDAVEAGGFEVTYNNKHYRYFLPETAVFEDRRVRLIARASQPPLMLIIKSYLDKGSALALFELKNEQIIAIGETPAIGTPNRWLNVVGVQDFIGDGTKQIAAVLMPHIRGSLRLYSLPDLSDISSLEGYTNHIIGERDIDLGRTFTFNKQPSLLLPTVTRNELAIIQVQNGKLVEVKRFPMPSKIRKIVSVQSNKTTVILDNGQSSVIDLQAK